MLVQITHRCYENCSHCFANATPDSTEFMTKETFVKAVNLASTLNSIAFQITGGEPTLHPLFFDMAAYARTRLERGIILESNGSFITNEEKTELIEQMPRNHVSVQIRTHPKYYPNYEFIRSQKDKFESMGCDFYDDGILLFPMGRAKKNFSEFPDRYPMCANLHLFRLQKMRRPQLGGRKYSTLIQLLQWGAGKDLCKPCITPSGDIHAGETQFCAKIGTLDSTDEDLFENFEYSFETCNTCGLKPKLIAFTKQHGLY